MQSVISQLNWVQLRRLRWKKRSATVWLALSTTITFAQAARCEAIHGWCLTQVHGISGSSHVYVSASGIKIVNDTTHLEIVSKAPSWQVVLYRPSQKIEFELPLKEWTRRGMPGLDQWHQFIDDWSRTMAQRNNYHGIPAVCILEKKDESSVVPQELGSTKGSYKVVGAEYWFSTSTPSPAGACAVLASYNALPVPPLQQTKKFGLGLPLSFITRCSDGESSWSLKTTAMRQIEIDDSTIEYPRGYKQAKDIHEVSISAQKRAELDDFAKDLDIGKKFGK